MAPAADRTPSLSVLLRTLVTRLPNGSEEHEMSTQVCGFDDTSTITRADEHRDGRDLAEGVAPGRLAGDRVIDPEVAVTRGCGDGTGRAGDRSPVAGGVRRRRACVVAATRRRDSGVAAGGPTLGAGSWNRLGKGGFGRRDRQQARDQIGRTRRPRRTAARAACTPRRSTSAWNAPGRCELRWMCRWAVPHARRGVDGSICSR